MTYLKSRFDVLAFLARNGPATKYDIEKKLGSRGPSHGTIHNAVRKLFEEGCLKEASRPEIFRTRKLKVTYGLTMKGFLVYLADYVDSSEEVEQAVQTYSKLLEDYPLFSESAAWEKWLGKGYYQLLRQAAWWVRMDVSSLELDDRQKRREESLEGEILRGWREGWQRGHDQSRAGRRSMSWETFLRWRYALTFLGLIGPTRATDPKIRAFIQDILQQEASDLKSRSEEIERLKQDFLS